MNRHLQILPLAVSLAVGTWSLGAAADDDTIRMLEQQLEQQQHFWQSRVVARGSTLSMKREKKRFKGRF